MSFNNIPLELQAIPQWCCWRYVDIGAEKPSKEPFYTRDAHMSVTNPATWLTFEAAVKLHGKEKFDGIGFILADDPYSVIDLDDTKGDATKMQRQIEVHKEFDTYSEISPSGLGLHLVVKGNVPAGRKRSAIEIYSSVRYITFTGNVYNNKPIRECQDQLMRLWEQMGSGPATHIYNQVNEPEKLPDAEIIKMASNAANGDKFDKLYDGRWQEVYPHIAAAGQGPSEADFALIDIVAFYTKNRAQIKRIFYASGLGKRQKVQRQDYVDRMILNAFDRMLPPIDFDGFQNQLELKLAEGKKQNATIIVEPTLPGIGVAAAIPASDAIAIPPGLLGELAQFIYAAAPRPVPEIALAGAIGLMSGIVGRAYNISGTGLNQYILLLADTGTGKEAMASGIDKLMNAIRGSVPTSVTYIGPSEIASGQALIKHINKFSQCFVSILGEFGLRLQSMSSQHASSAEVGLRRILLDLYNKSGYGQVWRGTIYADREKNVDSTKSPSFTILGESTPERFYGALNEEMISEGLLPRFLIMEYLGVRPSLNKSSLDAVPPFPLVDKFASLVAQCETVVHKADATGNNNVVNVQCDPIAQKMLDEFDEYATNLINKSDKDIIKQLWNRAHIKALKLAALVAVGVNMLVPTITPQYVEWAIAIIRHDIRALSQKFEAGLIGLNSGEIKQMTEATKRIREYFSKPWEEVRSYCPSCQDLHHNRIIPYEYFSTRISTLAAFKSDKLGQTNAIKRTVQTLIDNGKLEEITKTKQYMEKYNRGSKRAFIAKPELFD